MSNLTTTMSSTTTTTTTLESINVGVCGIPCEGGCATCAQSRQELEAFYREPGDTIILTNILTPPSSTPQSSEQALAEVMEAARALDEADYARASGEGADIGDDYEEEEEEDYEDDYDEDDDDDRYGCHCINCLNHDEPDWVDTRGYDGETGETGLDWNESGYFD